MTTATGIWFLTIMYGAMPLATSTSNAFYPMSISRTGPLTYDTCMKAAKALNDADQNFHASCDYTQNGIATVTVQP